RCLHRRLCIGYSCSSWRDLGCITYQSLGSPRVVFIWAPPAPRLLPNACLLRFRGREWRVTRGLVGPIDLIWVCSIARTCFQGDGVSKRGENWVCFGFVFGLSYCLYTAYWLCSP